MSARADAESGEEVQSRYVHVWDLWVRLSHWLFVALVVVLWWSAGAHRWAVHILAGEAMLGLLGLRVAWGFLGTTTARFRHFLKPPAEVLAYARSLPCRRGHIVVGHNPMGGWSIIAMLALLIGMVVSGLFAQNIDGYGSGPLSIFVSYRVAELAATCHQALFPLLIFLVGLHLSAIAFYTFYKRQNLLRAMLTGYARLNSTMRDSEADGHGASRR